MDNQLNFSPDQQFLVSLARKESTALYEQAAKMEQDAKTLRVNADRLMAEVVSRIATKNGASIPKDGEYSVEWLNDNGMPIGMRWVTAKAMPVASEAKSE